MPKYGSPKELNSRVSMYGIYPLQDRRTRYARPESINITEDDAVRRERKILGSFSIWFCIIEM